MSKDEKKDSGEEEDSEFYKRMAPLRNAGPLLYISSFLGASVFVGYLIGSFIEKRKPMGGLFIAIFVILGFVAGFKEMLRLVKNTENNNKKDE